MGGARETVTTVKARRLRIEAVFETTAGIGSGTALATGGGAETGTVRTGAAASGRVAITPSATPSGIGTVDRSGTRNVCDDCCVRFVNFNKVRVQAQDCTRVPALRFLSK